jgi:hypothetical protein
MRLTPNQISILQAMATGCALCWKPRGVAGVELELDELGLGIDAGMKDLWIGDHRLDINDHDLYNQIIDLIGDGLIVQDEPDILDITHLYITNYGRGYVTSSPAEHRAAA